MRENQKTIYTFGSQKRWPSQLEAEAVRHCAVVVDCRFNPRSRLPDWTRGSLSSQLGKRYLWMQWLGNENYTEGMTQVSLMNPIPAVQMVAVLLKTSSIILLCYEENPADCHRTQVAALLAEETGLPVEHLLRAGLQLPLL